MSELHARTIDCLKRLVAYDTTSRESNLSLMSYIQDYLGHQGLSGELFHNTHGDKASLLLRIGPEVAGGIMLSGHTDVVPVDGQAWSTPPFELSSHSSRHYGRGTADMKGFIACVLAVIPFACQQNLKRPLWLAFSYDEEVGCLGVHDLLAHLAQCPIKPALCIVGEPTEMVPVYGHKGKVALKCRVRGHACHSAYTPDGVNAINYAARLITFILNEDDKLSQVTNPHFTPPFSTLHVGTIVGGEALNIVPETCDFDLELRYLPDKPPEPTLQAIKQYAVQQLLPEMQSRFASSAIEFTQLSAYPALYTPPDTVEIEQLLVWTGKQMTKTVAFGTEAGLFSECAIPSVVCGPGSMEQGHKPDEFISDQQLHECLGMLQNVITALTLD